MSTGNNEISQEKKNFISNVAQAIKSKLKFRISGYGSTDSQNIFSYLVAPERYDIEPFLCRDQLAQRMKYEFGGCQITSVSELMELIKEISYCDWSDYWEGTTKSEQFLNLNNETKEIYQKYVESLRDFWGYFLFNGRTNDSMSEKYISLAIKTGISDENHPLKKDYQVIVDGIIKSVDDLIRVMAFIYENKTYFYFDPGVLISNIASKLTVPTVFEQVTLEQLKKILAIQKTIMSNWSGLDGIFKVEFDYGNAPPLFRIIDKILGQSNNVEIVQEIMQWIKSFKDENPEFIYNVFSRYGIYIWLDNFIKGNMQLKLNDVCDLLATCFKQEKELHCDALVDLLGRVLICCSDDISKNNAKLDLDFILNIKQKETLVFPGSQRLFMFFEILSNNMGKISFSDDFIKKVLNSTFSVKCGYVSLERWIYDYAYYFLLDSENDEEKRKSLTALKMTIDFILKNSLTKATKEDGDRFVKSLAQIINDSGHEREKDKLVVDFVFKVLRDSKMADREKLFIDTLVSELRPEITSIDNETEQENLNIDGTKPNLHENSKPDNNSTETNLNHDAEVSQIATEDNLGCKADNKGQKIGTQLQHENPNTQTGGQPKKGLLKINQESSNTQDKVLNFSKQLENIYFGCDKNRDILEKTPDELYNYVKRSPNFCRDVCILETMLESKKCQVLRQKLTSFQRFRVTIYYYCFFWWYYRRNSKMDFSQPGIGNYCGLKHNLGKQSEGQPGICLSNKTKQREVG